MNGPVSVLSCAGSGKTASTTARCGYLISEVNVDPERLLLLTFTNKAAKNMKERLVGLPSITKKVADKITAGTFHTVFKSFLIEKGDTRTIWSSGRSKEITVKIILRSMGLEKKYRAEDVISLISHNKNKMISVDEYPVNNKAHREFKAIYEAYEKHKKQNNLMDFDDMLLDSYKLFIKNPEYLKEVQNRFDYVMGDETQDVNDIQFKLLRMIATPKNNLFIVADDDQVIFSFNGAKSSNIIDFNKNYPKAKTIALDINYRSSDHIIGLSNAIIKENTKRIIKNMQSVKPSEIPPEFILCDSPDSEAKYIVDQIKYLVEKEERKYSDFAILHRSGIGARAVFEELLLSKVPFTSYGGAELFYEGYIIEPMLAYLKLSYNPSDMKSIEKILPTLYLGKDKMKLISQKEFMNSIANPLEHVIDSLKPFQRSKVADKIRQISRIAEVRPNMSIRIMREDYEAYLISEDSDTNTSMRQEIIKETLNELEQSSKRFATNKEFIEYVEMIIKNSKIQKESQKKENYNSVKLMTIHKSKGLEFPHVFGIGCAEGNLPHSSSFEECSDIINENDDDPIEEERRLAYVMTSRAEKWLTLSASRIDSRGNAVDISRFFKHLLTPDDDNPSESIDLVSMLKLNGI